MRPWVQLPRVVDEEALAWRRERLRENFGDFDTPDSELLRARIERVIGTVVEGFCPYDSLPLVNLYSRIRHRRTLAGCIAGHYWIASPTPFGFQAEEVWQESEAADGVVSYFCVPVAAPLKAD